MWIMLHCKSHGALKEKTMKLTELKKNPGKLFVRCLQIGPAGIGKTCTASTFPKPIYYFDCEDGIKSLLPYYDYDEAKLEGIEFDSYLDKDPKKPDAYTRIQSKLTDFESKPVFPYKTLVFDSLTTIEDRIMNQTIFEVQTKRVKGKVANQQDYGLVIWDIEEFVQRLLTLPCNIVLNCHVQVIQNDLTREILTMPLVVGKKLPQKLPIWFDEVYQLHFKDNKRMWQLRPEGQVTLPKTRLLPKSTPTFVDADYFQLAQHLQ